MLKFKLGCYKSYPLTGISSRDSGLADARGTGPRWAGLGWVGLLGLFSISLFLFLFLSKSKSNKV